MFLGALQKGGQAHNNRAPALHPSAASRYWEPGGRSFRTLRTSQYGLEISPATPVGRCTVRTLARATKRRVEDRSLRRFCHSVVGTSPLVFPVSDTGRIVTVSVRVTNLTIRPMDHPFGARTVSTW